MRLLCSFTIGTCLLLGQGRKPDFTGTWQTDESKSTTKITVLKNPDPDAAYAPPPPPPPLGEEPPEVIEQKGNKLKIGEQTFPLDGTENASPMADESLLHRAKAHWDGNKLVTEFAIERDGKTLVKGTQVRSLSEDGKTQTVDTHVQTSQAITDSHSVKLKRLQDFVQ